MSSSSDSPVARALDCCRHGGVLFFLPSRRRSVRSSRRSLPPASQSSRRPLTASFTSVDDPSLWTGEGLSLDSLVVATTPPEQVQALVISTRVGSTGRVPAEANEKMLQNEKSLWKPLPSLETPDQCEKRDHGATNGTAQKRLCGCAGAATHWWLRLWGRRHRDGLQRHNSATSETFWDVQSEGWMSARSMEDPHGQGALLLDTEDSVREMSLETPGPTTASSTGGSRAAGRYGIPKLVAKVVDHPMVKNQVVLHEHTHWGKHEGMKFDWTPCICSFPSMHVDGFDPEIPINRPPAPIVAGSYFEAVIHARSICGHWITDLGRSDSLDPQMQHIGLGRLKRSVMNRLAIPFTAVMENDDTLLHSWIQTPLGPKRMRASLLGEEITDVDNEVGTWAGVARMVDFSRPWFCGGRPVRALQLHRWSTKHGTAFETRVVLPDKKEGKILLFNITLYPREEDRKPPIIVDRILKWDRP